MDRRTGGAKPFAVAVAVVGVVLIVAGGVTWFVVQDQLVAEKITVAEDADFLAGDEVDGPFSAYAQAQVINKHALEATGGKTYAELEQDDPVREVAMSASFLRASLFTSVVAFGVAAMAIGLGLTLILIALALLSMVKSVERDRVARSDNT
ncbi:MAG TPA: aromatic ring-opening dioxygenase LigA [Nocardioides sp.]|nr:aromatic ring-opening dioxygenase LigA [Nocardioides sp.]